MSAAQRRAASLDRAGDHIGLLITFDLEDR